jgi:hypothetical protein
MFMVLLLLSAAVLQLHGQQTETNRKKATNGDTHPGGGGWDAFYTNSIKAKAEAGDPNSEFQLGLAYANGQGVAKDLAEAVKWYRKAAEQNFAPAQTSLGYCYEGGIGVAKDDVEAVKWFRKAAEQNFAPAQSDLGARYCNGVGVAKDYVEGYKWLRKAAEQNFADAQNNLGACYYNGQGVAKDYVEGYKWWLLAAAQGDEDAKPKDCHERLTSGCRHSFGLRSLFDLLEGRISVDDPMTRFVNFGRINCDRAQNRLGSRDQLAFKLDGFRALDWKFPVMREFVDGVKHGLGFDGVHPAATHRVVEHPVAILPWPVFLLVSGVVQH